jgi:hypothetical protein
MKKKKKYQEGGTESTPFSVDDQIIDYTNFLSPDSMDMLNYYQTGGVDYYQSGGGEMNGNSVMPFVAFNGDKHSDPSRGIFLGKGGDNPRKVQDGEYRVFVDMFQMGGMEAMQQGAPQMPGQGMPMQGPQDPAGMPPQEKVPVILGDMKDPETGKEYQKLAAELEKVAKNDPTNTRVQDEIKKKMEELALKQEAQRIIEEKFPDGPPPPPSPEQAEALNQNMAMMQMLQGAGQQMQQPQMQQNPIGTEPMDPEAVPLAQTGRIENPYDTSSSINRDMPWKKTNAFDKTGFFTEDEKIAITQDPNQPKYVSSGNSQIEAGRANALSPDGGVSKYNLFDKMAAIQENQSGMIEGIPEYQAGFPEIDYTEGRPAMTPEEAAIIASMYGKSGGTSFNTNFLDDNYYAPRQRVASTDIDPYADEDLSGMEGRTSRRARQLSGYTTVDGSYVDEPIDPESKSEFGTPYIIPEATADALYNEYMQKKAEDTTKASGTKDKDKDGQPDYLGMGILAGAGLASNIGNIMYLAEQGKKAEYEDPGKYMVDPRLISLDEQRKDIETRMNRVAYENRMRGQGDITREAFLAGQELQQMAPTYEREQNLNAQIINQADQFNAQMRMTADDINARNRAAALKQYYDSISQIGQNINNLAIDINQRRENAQMYKLLEDYFPNYGLQNGQWVFKGTAEDKA